MSFQQEMSVFGSYIIYLIVMLSFLAFGKTQQFLQLLIAISLLYFIVIPIRLLFFEARPKKESYFDLISKFKANSLISLHAARALILAIILAAYFKFNIAFIVVEALAVGMVCISRFLLKKHWLWDIATGLLIGAGVSLLVLTFIF